ncbi:hypothetical protein K2173_024268 [Erythroxylum novogranatense]|uniref:Uncharacterized protein n=1 Tax=Erythroxylum novogranatense TaxID=1862640 RepID=A0AAV8SUV1_9ROSI|nr:hypothetical protein K2173_024268 [Erythroxylum novogranatense]
MTTKGPYDSALSIPFIMERGGRGRGRRGRRGQDPAPPPPNPQEEEAPPPPLNPQEDEAPPPPVVIIGGDEVEEQEPIPSLLLLVKSFHRI